MVPPLYPDKKPGDDKMDTPDLSAKTTESGSVDGGPEVISFLNRTTQMPGIPSIEPKDDKE